MRQRFLSALLFTLGFGSAFAGILSGAPWLVRLSYCKDLIYGAMRKAFFVVIVWLFTTPLWASGHGPLFGLATPTNVKGGWSFDSGLMGRQGSDTDLMFRAMAGYGITEDLQISFSAPWMIESAPLSPNRFTGMMSGGSDLETILSWRFHRKGISVGTRVESTLFTGLVQPSPQSIDGMMGELEKSPGFLAGITTGMASRSHYLWIGSTYTKYSEAEGDRRASLLFYSLVWGYRPKTWQKEYPHWDWRLFAEMTGEKADEIKMNGQDIPGTSGHSIFVGPSFLAIYKHYAISAGIQAPVYQEIGSAHQKEKIRYAINFSTFF